MTQNIILYHKYKQCQIVYIFAVIYRQFAGVLQNQQSNIWRNWRRAESPEEGETYIV
jgi:hypothetical protein